MRISGLLVLFVPVVSFAAESVDYNPIGRRDPFQVTIEPAKPVTATTVLERFDLTEMRLDGIISGISDPRASVTVDGHSFVVRAGTRMGKWGGRVARITASEVVVREESTSHDGILQVKETSLTLPDAEK